MAATPAFIEIPTDVAGETVITNSLRSRRWFLTSFDFKIFLAFKVIAAESDNEANPPLTFLASNQDHDIQQYILDIRSRLGDLTAMIFQEETAPSTGRQHWHAGVIFKEQKSRRQLQAIFGFCDMRVMKGTPFQAAKYVTKGVHMTWYIGDAKAWETKAAQAKKEPIDWLYVMDCCKQAKSYSDFIKNFAQNDETCRRAFFSKANCIRDIINANSPPKMPTTHMNTIWQDGMLSTCQKEPIETKRVIHWFWSSSSGTGKSSIIDILLNANIDVFVWPQGAELKDAVYMYRNQRVVVFDIPRDGRIETIYPLLETVSDQTIVSTGKYNGVVTRFYAHVIVTCNFAPDFDRLPGRIKATEVRPFDQEDYAEADFDIVARLSFESPY